MVPTLSKRELIIAAARSLFLDRGYGSTSMDAIAIRAGVSKNTVYSHFNDKESLFGEVIGELCKQQGGPKAYDLLPDGTPKQVLRALGRKFALHGLLGPQLVQLYRVVLAEIGRFPELGRVLWAGPNNLQSRLARYLLDLHERGVLLVPDADLAARQFVEMVKGPYLMPLLFAVEDLPAEIDIERGVDQAVDIFVGGLSA